MITIDPNSIISSFNNKCTLLQAINQLNDKIETIKVIYEHKLLVTCIREDASNFIVKVTLYSLDNNKMTSEDFENYIKARPFLGVDCSMLISSETSITDIPYTLVYENDTFTMGTLWYNSVTKNLATRKYNIVGIGVNDSVSVMGGVQ